jgi:hypothetical protein
VVEGKANAAEPVQADEDVQEVLLVDNPKCQAHGPADPAGGRQGDVDAVEQWQQRETVEEQGESVVEQVLKGILITTVLHFLNFIKL